MKPKLNEDVIHFRTLFAGQAPSFVFFRSTRVAFRDRSYRTWNCVYHLFIKYHLNRHPALLLPGLHPSIGPKSGRFVLLRWVFPNFHVTHQFTTHGVLLCGCRSSPPSSVHPHIIMEQDVVYVPWVSWVEQPTTLSMIYGTAYTAQHDRTFTSTPQVAAVTSGRHAAYLTYDRQTKTSA